MGHDGYGSTVGCAVGGAMMGGAMMGWHAHRMHGCKVLV